MTRLFSSSHSSLDAREPTSGHGRFFRTPLDSAAAIAGCNPQRLSRRDRVRSAVPALAAARFFAQPPAPCSSPSFPSSQSIPGAQQQWRQQLQQPPRQQRHTAWRSRSDISKVRGAPARFRENDTQAPSADAAKHAGTHRTTVPVILKYGKRCNFGEGFAVVGSDPELGSWDPAKSVKMRWTPGDVWVAHVQLPVDTEVQYKYVRVNKDGAVVAWEGVDAANGGAAGPMGNINLHVRPGHRVIWGHGVEVYADLPPEYANFAGTPLPGTSIVMPISETTSATTAIGGGGGGVLSGMKETARGALAALESALTGGTGGSAGAAHAGGTSPGATTAADTIGAGTSYGSETGASGTYPSFTPAPGVGGATIGEVATAANAPASTHNLHAAPAATDYSLVDPTAATSTTTTTTGEVAVPHITSTDLAASLIAAGPAAGAVSAAALGMSDEAGNIPVVTPASSVAATHGGGGSGVNAANNSLPPPPSGVTMPGTPADQSSATVETSAAMPFDTDITGTTGATDDGPGNNGTGESSPSGGVTGDGGFGGASGGGGGGGRRRGPGFFRK